jgi:hypothetical protein
MTSNEQVEGALRCIVDTIRKWVRTLMRRYQP